MRSAIRHRLLVIALVGGVLAAGALAILPSGAAAAQSFGLANDCPIPLVGKTVTQNQPCWVSGIFASDYTGTDDTDFYTQAGGHPFVGVIDFKVSNSLGIPSGNTSKIRVDLPPGLISNPQAVPQCSESDPANCPASSQLGVVVLDASLAGLPTDSELGASVYNMVPPAGKVSDYAFTVPLLGSRVDIIGGIRSGAEQSTGVPNLSADDGLYFTIDVPSLPAQLISSTLIFWGVPGDSAHAPDIGWSCLSVTCNPPASAATHDPSGTPFLTLPSGCLPAGQVSTLTLTDSSGDVAQALTKTPAPATGCATAGFAPTLSLTPQTTQAATPTGVRMDVHVPQNENPSQVASSTLGTATVKLPPGMSLDPSAANGLQACSAAAFADGSDAVPSCPAASKVGTVEIDTPLLPGPLTGSVYLGCNGASAATPCTPGSGGGVAPSLYVYATAPAQGVDQKLVGTVSTDPVTGQVTATFAHLPQLPFSDFVLNLNGGATAPIANPGACGTATTNSSLSPYSGAAAATPSSSFVVSSGCQSGFSPSFATAAQTTSAGVFSPLALSFSRPDSDQNLSGLTVQLPPGLLAKLAGVQECTDAELAAAGGKSGAAELASPSCPAGSLVGTVTARAGVGGDPVVLDGKAYLTGPYKGAPFGLAVVVPAVAGPFDLGTVVVRQQLQIDATKAQATVVSDPFQTILGGVPLDIQRVDVNLNRPGFTLNPTVCGPLSVNGTLSSTGGLLHAVSSPLQFGGCGSLGFSPSLSVKPDTTVADSPAGVSVDLSLPQAGLVSGNGASQATLKDATVTLPAGVTLDPSAAAGLTGCMPGQVGLDQDSTPATCADSSKVGTAEIDTPLLPDPLTGSIYVAQPYQNPFDSLFAIYVVAQGDGVLVKLAGHVVADPVTGQLTTTFSNNPQVPFSDLKLTFNGGPRGILVTPGQCGSYTAGSSLSPWSGGAAAAPSSSFSVSSGCQTGFSPALSAAMRTPRAGAFSPLDVSFARTDADQDLSGLSVKLAPGMLAKLAGVKECTGAELKSAAGKSGTAEQAAPSCPAGSRVGVATTDAGVGPAPFALSGKVYLTGPYKGAPFGLAVVVPALAGPFDLGTVVVRQQLRINPTTAQVTVVSDPLPTILDGVPLDVRRVDVDLNRPRFTVNPTSCKAISVNGSLSSTAGKSASVKARLQTAGCARLKFTPKLTIGLTGKGKTRSGDHPTLTATLKDPAKQANIKSAKVTLPLSLALDPENSNHVCAFKTAEAVHGGKVRCSASTVVGKATAATRLLAKPLAGKVYLVQGLRCQKGQPSAKGTCPGGRVAIRTLPSLLVALRGQIALDLRAQTSVSHGKLVSTFPAIPDAPVSKFTLKISGGKKGLLVITGRGKSICKAPQVGSSRLGAQSGKRKQAKTRLNTPCGKRAHGKKAKPHARSARPA